MVHVSPDGLNANLRLLNKLGEKIRDENLTMLIDLGTYGLHTVHNALQHREVASGWKMKKLMSQDI